MSKFEEKLRRKPTPTDIMFNELSSYMKALGFSEKIRVDAVIFFITIGGRYYSVSVAKPHPSSKPVLRCYIENVKKELDRIADDGLIF